MTAGEAIVVLGRAGKLMWEDFEHVDTAEFHQRVLGGYEPDLTSPKDCGCLLALLREASGDRRAYVCGSTGDTIRAGAEPPWRVHWCSWDYTAKNYRAPTGGADWREPPRDGEGKALAAALIRMAVWTTGGAS